MATHNFDVEGYPDGFDMYRILEHEYPGPVSDMVTLSFTGMYFDASWGTDENTFRVEMPIQTFKPIAKQFSRAGETLWGEDNRRQEREIETLKRQVQFLREAVGLLEQDIHQAEIDQEVTVDLARGWKRKYKALRDRTRRLEEAPE